jgi:hypothetical protein
VGAGDRGDGGINRVCRVAGLVSRWGLRDIFRTRQAMNQRCDETFDSMRLALATCLCRTLAIGETLCKGEGSWLKPSSSLNSAQNYNIQTDAVENDAFTGLPGSGERLSITDQPVSASKMIQPA